MRLCDPEQIVCSCTSTSFERITFLDKELICLICSDCGAELVAYLGDDSEVECHSIEVQISQMGGEMW